MNFAVPNFLPALPEIFLLVSICGVLVVDLFLTDEQRWLTYVLAQFALLLTALAVVFGFSGETVTTFGGMFIGDPLSVLLKVVILLFSTVIFLYSFHYLRAGGQLRGEFFTLALFGILGMMIMVSAHNLLLFYVGLETFSLCLYTLVAYNRDAPKGAEAAVKYFFLGALSSGLLLYGFSLLYGTTGTLSIPEMAAVLTAAGADGSVNPATLFGVVFVVIAIAFKLGLVPFHMWVPDLYEGAPTPVTLYLSTVGKLAALGMAVRLLVDGLGPLFVHWQELLVVLAVLSIALGNLVAIVQTNIKRLLAYSTISHMGFFLLGLLTGTPDGYSAALYYMVVYALTGIAGFGVILLLSRKGFEAERIDDYKGLGRRQPWYAFLMMLVMLSLAGVPPLVGFWAKYSVLMSVISIDMIWLALYALVFSVVGAFYYLRVIKVMFFEESPMVQPVSATADMHWTLTLNALALLGFGLIPGGLLDFCRSVWG
ncbi:MAG: NADH-quinone oxidoreductase subunit NuoN [Gammaproteobacteria bacterium]|nr:NADH-quinone oxidoreductase subunit NuoN [Gammaproteobacteria bacterium]